MSTIADREKRTWVGAGEGQGRSFPALLAGRGEIDIDTSEPTQRVPRGRWNLARALLVFP
jgi:hypothetical protein